MGELLNLGWKVLSTMFLIFTTCAYWVYSKDAAISRLEAQTFTLDQRLNVNQIKIDDIKEDLSEQIGEVKKDTAWIKGFLKHQLKED